MFWYVLLSIGTLANAQWSKIQCTPPARVDNNVAIMTSQSINNVRTTCSPTDTFKKNIFIQFKRTYTEKPKRVSDSTISFDFSSIVYLMELPPFPSHTNFSGSALSVRYSLKVLPLPSILLLHFCTVE